MFRWFLNCCLIVALLWCPLRCQAMPTGLRAGESTPAKKCRCCRHVCTPSTAASDSTRNNAPAESEDCGCGSCLCEGAVVRSLEEVEAPAMSSDVVGFGLAVVVTPTTLDASVPSTDSPPRIFSSGHDIAVLYGNLRR